MTPDFVVVGHLTLDLDNGGGQLGGAAYSALAAARLGRRVGLISSYGPELSPEPDLGDVQVALHPSPRSTVFRNSYRGGCREQKVLSAAQRLEAADVPEKWRRAAAVHLAPMLGEVGPEFLEAFPEALMAASPQGWLRRVGPDGTVEPASWPWAGEALPRLDATIVSREDLQGNEALALEWAAKTRCLVVTGGEEGAWVYYSGQKRHVRVFAAGKVVDPTGAGDVFASSFLVKWAEGADPFLAATFASVVASFVVEQKGLAGVPTMAQVEARWRCGS